MIRVLLIASLWVCSLCAQAGTPSQVQMYGAIEHWNYDQERQQISVRGWAIAGQGGATYPELRLKVDADERTATEVTWTERADLIQATSVTGGQLGRGFAFTLNWPKAISGGIHPMRLTAVFSSATVVVLHTVSDGDPNLIIKAVRPRHWWILAIILISGALIHFGRRLQGGRLLYLFQRWVATHAYSLISLVFLIIVTIGVTGGSQAMLFESPFGKSLMDVSGSQGRLFGLRAVRGDEWGVLTPDALAQLHHVPQFPVVNSNIGLNGQNMGVMHMTAVPVYQWSALARPATWGYFFLPLRQAMSWQWQLPFWGCLIALWGMLNVLRSGQRGFNFGLALTFCVAPYAAAWSNWPLYATLFPALAFILFAKILTANRVLTATVFGVCLGWSLVAWALILYPTWIIILGSVLAFVGVGWALDRREDMNWGSAQVTGIFVAIITACLLLGSWWLDTKDAIALMRATVYPGARGTMQGGDLAWWWHLRGYNNADVVLRTPGSATNQSEASSYFFLPLVMLVLAIGHLASKPTFRWAITGCVVFFLCYWIYSFVGIPTVIAKYSLWGNMPTVRMDVGMGLAATILFALTYSTSTSQREQRNILRWPVQVIGGVGTAALIAWSLSSTPPQFMPGSSSIYMVAMAAAGAFAAWSLLGGRMAAGVAMIMIVHLITTLPFNPLSLAPTSVDLAGGHRPYVTDSKDSSRRLRTLVLNGDGIGAMVFAAVGIPIVNGVLHYPHADLWRRMELDPADESKVNRYQHLGFYLESDVLEKSGYRVVLSGLDQVHVHIHPERFDFFRTGAERVVVLQEQAQLLKNNSSLIFLGSFRGLHWFAVRPKDSDGFK